MLAAQQRPPNNAQIVVEPVAFLMAEGIYEVCSQSCESAACTGQQATVAWLLEHGATLSTQVAAEAAESGDVQFLKVSTAQPAAAAAVPRTGVSFG